MSGDHTRAEVSYLEAMRIAEQQGSGSLTLRGAAGLARLHKARGRGEEGRQLLTHALSSIVDGENTHDVRQARDLMHTL